jgi:hypothetical protein
MKHAKFHGHFSLLIKEKVTGSWQLGNTAMAGAASARAVQ